MTGRVEVGIVTAAWQFEMEQVIADRSERLSGLWEVALCCFCLSSAETRYIFVHADPSFQASSVLFRSPAICSPRMVARRVLDSLFSRISR